MLFSGEPESVKVACRLVNAEHQDGHARQGRAGNDAGGGGDFIFLGFGLEKAVRGPAEHGPCKEEEGVVPLDGPGQPEADGGGEPFSRGGKVAGDKHQNEAEDAARDDGENLDAVQVAEAHAQRFRRGRPCSGSRSIEGLKRVHVWDHGAEGQHGDEGSQEDSGKLGDELLAGIGPQQVAHLEVHEQVCRRTGGSGGDVGRHQVGRHVSRRDSAEDELRDFPHGSGGRDVGLPGDPADDQRQEEGDDYCNAAHPVRNVKGDMGQVAEGRQGDELPCQEPAHGRFYFFHVRQLTPFGQGKHGAQGGEGAGDAFPLEQEGHDAGDDHAGGSSPQGPAYAIPVARSRGKQSLAFQPRYVKRPADRAPDEEAEGSFHAYQRARAHEHEVPFEENGALVPVAQDLLLGGAQPLFPSRRHGDGVGGGEEGGVKERFGLSSRLFAF